MCGICGFYSTKGVFTETELREMASSLTHRGPNASGFFKEGAVGLGHRRLSIIDLSEAANQPMFSHNGRYAIVYNGEVYNFNEIAKEISILYPEFRMHTRSDTEVILELFSLLGVEFVHKLNGMFAIAIYDKMNGSLYLFRDRMGIKPLYYYWDGLNFAFASELKALKCLRFIHGKLTVNYTAINEYLHLGYIPEPHSIYENICKLPSGSFLQLSNGQLNVNNYWNVEEKLASTAFQDEQEATEKLKELLISSVQYRMISDVPYGTFLSGGIDSSLITALAQSLSVERLKTYNIRFEDRMLDESPYARMIAAYLGTDHHEYTVTEKDAMDLIPKLNDIYDEPFADSSAIPTLLVSKMARQQVTMTLSGDGGDELFLGYGVYKWALRLNKPQVQSIRKYIRFTLPLLSNRYRRAAYLFMPVFPEMLKSHIFSQEQYYFSRKEIARLVQPEFYKPFDLLENYDMLPRDMNAAEQQSLFDLNYYLKDDLLVKVDRASMHFGLETRVPLLDYRIVEFAANLPFDMKYSNGQTKYLLKKILYHYIPAEYFDRPKKGFSIPLKKWLKKDLQYLIHDYLSTDKIKTTGILNHGEVIRLKEDFLLHNRNYLYNRLWQLIVLQKYLLGR